LTELQKVRYRALDLHVLAVAVEGAVGDWAAYIGSVEGNNHHNEYRKVRDRGSKLPKEVAELLFPDFKKLRWRY